MKADDEICVHCFIEDQKISFNINGVCDTCHTQHFEAVDVIMEEMSINPVYMEYFPVGGREVLSTGNRIFVYGRLDDDDPLIQCWLKPYDLHYFIPIVLPDIMASILRNDNHAQRLT